MNKIEKSIVDRNKKWSKNPIIPKWVDVNTVDLDQFFTKSEVAKYCYDKLLSYLKSKRIKISDCLFIEPSAGSGAFFDLLPKENRIGLDICPLSNNIQKEEFLSWTPPKTGKKIIVIGNPPFGYRSWLALLFMQKASEFADFIAFILPMAFQSEGKGCPKNRIKNMRMVSSEILPKNSFVTSEGKGYKINSLFQIWEKGVSENKKEDTFKDYFDIFTVDNRKERLCGQDKMKKADFFLQRTYFNDPPKVVEDFKLVKYVCGYGFIIKKNKKQIRGILDMVNWNNYSNLAAHGCRHISMCHIRRALHDYGLKSTD